MTMAEDYQRGEMDVTEQSRTFSGFMVVTVWSSALTVLSVLALTLIFAVNTPWIVALGVTAALGVLAGYYLKLGGGWYATVFGLTVLSAIIGGVVSLLAALGG